MESPEQWIAAGGSVLSLLMAASLGGAYPFYKDNYLSLTMTQPFGNWGGVKHFYADLGGGTYADEAGFTLLADGVGWCNMTSPRALAPASRSQACACLHGVLLAFLGETAPNETIPYATADAYGGQALACLRLRGVWDVWGMGVLHPVALALALNGGMGVLLGAALLLSMGYSRTLVWGLTLGLVAACSAPMIAFHFQCNSIFVLMLLAVFVGIAYSLDEDLAPTGDEEEYTPILSQSAWAPPAGGCVALWWGMPLFTAGHVVYMGASHLIRDVPGLLGLGLLGFLLGLMAQRVYWTRVYVASGADAGGFLVTDRMARTFGAWSAYLLTLSLVFTWVWVMILLYTHSYWHGPYSAAWGSVLGGGLVLLTHLIGAFTSHSAVWLVPLANLFVGVIALADAGRQ